MRQKILIAFLLASLCGRAQFMDTLRELFKHKYSIDARIESRNSFIDHQLTSVSGIRIGVAFKRKFRLGGGVSWLKSDVQPDYYQRGALTLSDSNQKFLKFVYLCYYFDFVFYKTKRWQLSVPIQAGTGMSWFQDRSRYDFGKKSAKYLLLLYEPGITVQFKIFKWFGLGSDIAYRFTLPNNKRTAQQLNSPTYSFKILFWVDQLFYEALPESDITKKYGPAVW